MNSTGRKCFRRAVAQGRPASIVCAWLVGFVCCPGCGQSWQAETHPVRGSILINGHPPTGAVVTLYPAGEKVDERNSRPWGVVHSDGTFQLQTYHSQDGAPVGEYALTLKWPWDVADMSQALTDRLRGAYAHPENSKWSVSVVAGENVLDAIEINGAKVDARRGARNSNTTAGPPGPTTAR